MQMKTGVSLALAVALATGSCLSFAADTAKSGKPLTAQQQKMKNCNAEAKSKELKGPERKTFMKTCLSASGAPAVAAKTTQQEKMKTCSADAKAKELKGADRKAFMSTCLKGEGAAAH